jgi:negative regulator of flagellin synthesis FlgM
MSREVDLSNRAPFFPTNKSSRQAKSNSVERADLRRNTQERVSRLKGQTAGDAKVQISDAVRDFSRIKKAVDVAPPMDNSEKIARLKQQIHRGEYEMDYDAIADRMLSRQY